MALEYIKKDASPAPGIFRELCKGRGGNPDVVFDDAEEKTTFGRPGFEYSTMNYLNIEWAFAMNLPLRTVYDFWKPLADEGFYAQEFLRPMLQVLRKWITDWGKAIPKQYAVRVDWKARQERAKNMNLLNIVKEMLDKRKALKERVANGEPTALFLDAAPLTPLSESEELSYSDSEEEEAKADKGKPSRPIPPTTQMNSALAAMAADEESMAAPAPPKKKITAPNRQRM